MKRMSFNVNGGNVGNVAVLIDFLKRVMPTSVLVMDNDNLAESIFSETGGAVKVISRHWSAAEGGQWRDTSPLQYARELTNNFRRNNHIWLYVLNEPFAQGKDIETLTNWIIEVGHILSNENYQAILGNIGPSTWEARDIAEGRWDRYIHQLGEWSNADIHHGGWHEYTSVLIPFGIGMWPNSTLENRELVQPELWPTHVPIEKTGQDSNYGYPPYWHILRSSWFDIRAKEIGAKIHDKYITECFWDRMHDVIVNDNVFARLESKHGIPSGVNPEIRGAKTLGNIWRYYYPNWSFDRTMFEQLKWADAIYPKSYKGFNIFTWSNSIDWTRGGFNYSNLPELRELLINSAANNSTAPVSPQPDVTPEAPNNENVVITNPSEAPSESPSDQEGNDKLVFNDLTQRIGFNIQAQALKGSKPLLMDVLSKTRPTSTTVIDHMGLASEIADLLPESIVIHRDYSIGDDAGLWGQRSPEWVVDFYKRRHRDKRVWVYLLNEPHAHGDSLPVFVKWLTETTRALVREGFKVVSGNLPVGAVQASQIASGEYDEWIRMLAELKGNVVAGYHEYTIGILPYGVGQMNLEDLMYQDRVAPSRWPKRQDMPIEKTGRASNEGYPAYWHLLRGQWFNIRADEIGVDRHQSILTEFGVDRMGDVARHERRFDFNGYYANIYDHLEREYGLPQPWAFLRGHETYKYVWEGLFPGWSGERAFFEQLQWANEEAYPKDVLGFNIFAWTFNDDWDTAFGFNVARSTELHGLMEDYHNQIQAGEISQDIPKSDIAEPETPETEAPNSGSPSPSPFESYHKWDIAKLITGGDWSTNIRRTPTVSSEVVGRINKDNSIFNYGIDNQITMPDGVWTPIVGIENGHIVMGWVRNDVHIVEKYISTSDQDKGDEADDFELPSGILDFIVSLKIKKGFKAEDVLDMIDGYEVNFVATDQKDDYDE